MAEDDVTAGRGRSAEIVATLRGTVFSVARRGYDPQEVQGLLDWTATAIQRALLPDELTVLAEELESARFTPVADGFEAFAVRGVLRRTAHQLRQVADEQRLDPSDFSRSNLSQLDRVLAEMGDHASRLAELATAARSILAAAREQEVAETARRAQAGSMVDGDAGGSLTDTLREVLRLRNRALGEIEREVAARREQLLAELDEEVATRRQRGAGGDVDAGDR